MSIVVHRGARTQKEEKNVRREKEKGTLKHATELFTRYTLENIKNWKSIDLYYIMGITQEEAEKYGETEYKEAYKRQARLLHPDRLKTYSIQDNGLSFIALTRAHQTLSNPVRKRQYDCVIFDEEIPEDKEYSEEEFYEVFGEVFDRNKVYSNSAYGVQLGDSKTEEKDIVAFYKYWQSFSSSRSFEFLCVDDDCVNRDARRHAAQQNKEITDKKKAEDNMRIRKLVSLAIKHDPRIKSTKSAPKQNVTVDADGWKSNEIAKIVQLLASLSVSAKNRHDTVSTEFLRYFPSRQKKDLMKKIAKTDIEMRKKAAKK